MLYVELHWCVQGAQCAVRFPCHCVQLDFSCSFLLLVQIDKLVDSLIISREKVIPTGIAFPRLADWLGILVGAVCNKIHPSDVPPPCI